MSSQAKTIVWGAVISVAVLVGLALFTGGDSGKPSTASAGASALTAAETDFDFGSSSMAKGKVTHVYKVKNTTASPITVSRLYTSCMCTQASLVTAKGKAGPFGMMGHGYVPSISEEIAAGEEAQIEVVFDPAAHGPSGIGPVSRQIVVETNDGKDPLTLGFKAVVTP